METVVAKHVFGSVSLLVQITGFLALNNGCRWGMWWEFAVQTAVTSMWGQTDVCHREIFSRDDNHYPIYNHIYIIYVLYIYTCVHTCMSTRYTFISHYAATTSLIIHDLSSSLIIRYLHIFFSIFFRFLLFFPATMSSSCNSVRKNATTPPTMHTFHS